MNYMKEWNDYSSLVLESNLEGLYSTFAFAAGKWNSSLTLTSLSISNGTYFPLFGTKGSASNMLPVLSRNFLKNVLRAESTIEKGPAQQLEDETQACSPTRLTLNMVSEYDFSLTWKEWVSIQVRYK